MRRTKAEAEQTRQTLLTTARQLFAENGVAKTSLDQIAQAAGLTRGAVYWHFANKAELFDALREEMLMPLFHDMKTTLQGDGQGDPLQRVEDGMLQIVHKLEQNDVLRETFSLISLKCEYVGEFQKVLADVLPKSEEWVSEIRSAYHLAAQQQQLSPELDPDLLALESQAFIFGLIRIWLMDEAGKLRQHAPAMVRCHIATRRRHFPG